MDEDIMIMIDDMDTLSELNLDALSSLCASDSEGDEEEEEEEEEEEGELVSPAEDGEGSRVAVFPQLVPLLAGADTPLRAAYLRVFAAYVKLRGELRAQANEQYAACIEDAFALNDYFLAWLARLVAMDTDLALLALPSGAVHTALLPLAVCQQVTNGFAVPRVKHAPFNALYTPKRPSWMGTVLALARLPLLAHIYQQSKAHPTRTTLTDNGRNAELCYFRTFAVRVHLWLEAGYYDLEEMVRLATALDQFLASTPALAQALYSEYFMYDIPAFLEELARLVRALLDTHSSVFDKNTRRKNPDLFCVSHRHRREVVALYGDLCRLLAAHFDAAHAQAGQRVADFVRPTVAVYGHPSLSVYRNKPCTLPDVCLSQFLAYVHISHGLAAPPPAAAEYTAAVYDLLDALICKHAGTERTSAEVFTDTQLTQLWPRLFPRKY